MDRIKVLESSFISSANGVHDSPPEVTTEVAFLGRSNVGKSSLINMMLNKKLARSSNTPGKTKTINFFSSTWEFNSKQIRLIIVDMPGFGYAKTSKAERNMWDKNMSDFLYKRSSIKLLCHLIDSRHVNLDMDRRINEFLSKIERGDCKIAKVYTKSDKLKKSDLAKVKALGGIVVSTQKCSGGVDLCRQNLLGYILRNALGSSSTSSVC